MTAPNIPILIADSDGSTDLRFGINTFPSPQSLPVPFPPELYGEFPGEVEVRDTEFHLSRDLHVKLYEAEEPQFTVQQDGEAVVRAAMRIKGDEIKSSDDVVAIALDGANVEVIGNLDVDLSVTVGSSISAVGSISSESEINALGSITTAGDMSVDEDLGVGGNAEIGGTMYVEGAISSGTTKSFDIAYPNNPGMRIHHGSLEGPEHGVYLRGRVECNSYAFVNFPQYWIDLVDQDSITIHITRMAPTYYNMSNVQADREGTVEHYPSTNGFSVYSSTPFYYVVYGTRKDVPQFEVVYQESSDVVL